MYVCVSLHTHISLSLYIYIYTYTHIHIRPCLAPPAVSVATGSAREVDNIVTLVDIPSMLNLINHNGVDINNILDTRYTKSEVYNLKRGAGIGMIY